MIIVSSNNFTIELLHIDDTVDLFLFQNVSCQDKVRNVWFNYEIYNLTSDYKRYRAFYHKQGETFMCLTRRCSGKLYLTSVNSTNDRKCFFSTTNN